MRNCVYSLTVPMADNIDCTYIEADLISDDWGLYIELVC